MCMAKNDFHNSEPNFFGPFSPASVVALSLSLSPAIILCTTTKRKPMKYTKKNTNRLFEMRTDKWNKCDTIHFYCILCVFIENYCNIFLLMLLYAHFHVLSIFFLFYLLSLSPGFQTLFLTKIAKTKAIWPIHCLKYYNTSDACK